MKWETVTLGDISKSIQTGPFGSQLHQSDYSESGTPVVMPKDLINGRISTESIARVAENHVERLSRHKILPGDILYSRRGDVGRCAFSTEKEAGWLCGTGCLRVTIDREKANPKFVFYQLQTAKSVGWVEKHAVGATMLNLNTGILSAVPVAVPSLDEQNHVAKMLAAYDDLIENNQKQIALLEEAAQRLYKEWFIDLRFPSHESTPIHDGIPEGWEKTSIDSHITLYSGFAFKSSDFADKGQYRIVTIKNVKDAQFIGDNVSFIKEIPSQMPDHCKLSDGDILLSLTGNVGRVCLVFGDNYLLNQRVAKLCSPFAGFTYCLFRSKDMFDAMNNLANGAAQQNLSPIRTGKLEVLFPRSETAQQFEKIVVPMLQKIVLLNKEIGSAAHARDRLLPKLMSGEIEV
jgi:type I restriction enzyme S subunit